MERGGQDTMEEKKLPPGRKPRRFTRHRVTLPVTIVDQRGTTTGEILFDTTDLSIGGAFLRSALLFEHDEVLRLEFALPGSSAIRAQAKIVRVSTEGTGGMGVSFSDLSANDKEAIRRFLARQDATK
ncbi:MAG: PilZ domain-containing protein [Pseudomonadota bacterium]